MKIILSIVGFAVTGLCCGPLFSQNSDLLFYSAYYHTGNNRLEHRINQLPPTNIAGDHYNSPVITRTYFVPIDNDLALEPWMTKPFENTYSEAEMEIESWMTIPFENTYSEAEMEIESWMTTPFENTYQEADIDIELWMTQPFENGMVEAELPVEDWMTRPF